MRRGTKKRLLRNVLIGAKRAGRMPHAMKHHMYRSTIRTRLSKVVGHQSLERGPRPRSVYAGLSFASRVRRAPSPVGTHGSYRMRRQLFRSSSALKDDEPPNSLEDHSSPLAGPSQ